MFRFKIIIVIYYSVLEGNSTITAQIDSKIAEIKVKYFYIRVKMHKFLIKDISETQNPVILVTEEIFLQFVNC